MRCGELLEDIGGQEFVRARIETVEHEVAPCRDDGGTGAIDGDHWLAPAKAACSEKPPV